LFEMSREYAFLDDRTFRGASIQSTDLDSEQYSTWTKVLKLITVIGNVTNAAVGSGVLAFPFAFKQAGWAMGIILTVVFAFILGNSLSIILRFARKTRAVSYQDVVEMQYGKRWRDALTGSIALYTFFGCISYTLVSGSLMAQFWREFVDTEILTNQYYVTFLIFCITLPLCLLKNIDMLGPFSIVGILGIVFSVVTITRKAVPKNPSSDDFIPFTWSLTTVQSVPIICFALMCHLTAIPAVSGLRKYWPSSKTRNVEMWRAIVIVIISCFMICALLYTCMGYFGYRLFPTDVEEDILENFEGDEAKDIDVLAIKAAVAMTVIFSYPVLFFVGRLAIEDLFPVAKNNYRYHVLMAVVFEIGTISLALGCHELDLDIGFVNSIIGSTAAVVAQFLIPSFMFKDAGQPIMSMFYCGLAILIWTAGLGVIFAGLVCKHIDDSEFCHTLGL